MMHNVSSVCSVERSVLFVWLPSTFQVAIWFVQVIYSPLSASRDTLTNSVECVLVPVPFWYHSGIVTVAVYILACGLQSWYTPLCATAT